MITPTKPIFLKVGETEYPLSLGVSAICDVEKAFDLGVFQVVAKLGSRTGGRLSDFRLFLMKTMRDASGQLLSEEASIAAVDAAGVEASVAAVGEALQAIVAKFAGGVGKIDTGTTQEG